MHREPHPPCPRWTKRLLLPLLVLVALPACSTRSKKLTDGDVTDRLVYDVLGERRSAAYYYQLVRDSMDESTGCYRCTDDPFIVDKSVNAVLQLGESTYDRLEGQAQTVDLLSEVLLEAPSPMARSHAANSLAKIGLRMPPYAPGAIADDGRRATSYVRELDAMFDAMGRRRDPRSATRQIQLLDQLGDLRIDNYAANRAALRPYFTRAYLIDEGNAQIRRAIDTSMTRRMHQVISRSLAAGVQAPTDYVREESVRALKTLRDPSAVDAVLAQFEAETDPRVRGEMVEYFGSIGNARGVSALLPVLEDPDSTVRYKARLALTRVSGQDLGMRRGTWTRWAQQRYPGISLPAEEDLAAMRAPQGVAAGGR